jgi:hypothetical protein
LIGSRLRSQLSNQKVTKFSNLQLFPTMMVFKVVAERLFSLFDVIGSFKKKVAILYSQFTI